MAPFILLSRGNLDDHKTSPSAHGPTLSTVPIVGLCIVGALILGAAVWVGIVFYRRKAQEKREEVRNAAFLNVRGVVKDPESEKASSRRRRSSPDTVNTGAHMFSRANLHTVTMPKKAVSHPRATPEEILEHYASKGTMPRPFRPLSSTLAPQGSQSFSYNPSSDPRAPPHTTILASPPRPAPAPPPRASWISFRNSIIPSSNHNRSSTLSTSSTIRDSISYQPRHVRQVFTPILPDELTVSLGQTLTVLQSFDDGWCVVGAGTSMGTGTSQSQLGVIPAWCFLKPVKGLRAERPVRNTSLGVTVQLDTDADTPSVSRGDIISWSNF